MTLMLNSLLMTDTSSTPSTSIELKQKFSFETCKYGSTYLSSENSKDCWQKYTEIKPIV